MLFAVEKLAKIYFIWAETVRPALETLHKQPKSMKQVIMPLTLILPGVLQPYVLTPPLFFETHKVTGVPLVAVVIELCF